MKLEAKLTGTCWPVHLVGKTVTLEIGNVDQITDESGTEHGVWNVTGDMGFEIEASGGALKRSLRDFTGQDMTKVAKITTSKG